MIANSSDSGDSFDSINSDAVGKDIVAVIPQDLVNLVHRSKPDEVPFEDHLLECTRFGAEAFVKAKEISNNNSYLRELTESAKVKLYDTIADIGSEIGNKFTDEEGSVLAPFITTLEQSGSTLEGLLERVTDLEAMTDLGKTDAGFGQVVNELNQALDPNRVDSVPGLVSAEISNLFSDGSPQRVFLESLISPVLTELEARFLNDDMKAEARSLARGGQEADLCCPASFSHAGSTPSQYGMIMCEAHWFSSDCGYHSDR